MHQRSQQADLLKGIAILLMIQVHILELFASDSVSKSSIGNILMFLGGPPVAPIFALFLGYYMAASSKTLTQHLIRGFKIIGLGMLLNLALNFNLIISVINGLFQIDLLPYIFGIDILQFAGLSIIIIAILKKTLEKNRIIAMMLIAVPAFLSYFLMNDNPESVMLKYLTSPFFGSCSWSYFPLFPWLSYPLIGFSFFHFKKNINPKIFSSGRCKIIVGFLFILFLIFTIQKAVFISSHLHLYYHHGPFFMIWTICFLAFYSYFIFQADDIFGENKFFKYLKWLGKNVTMIYVIQWIITGNFLHSVINEK